MHMCLLQAIHKCGMPITIFTSRRSGHFLTNTKLFHGQGTLRGDAEGDGHGFFHSIRAAMST
jgi:hypothetical protein